MCDTKITLNEIKKTTNMMKSDESSESLELAQAESKRRRNQRKNAKMKMLESGSIKPNQLTNGTPQESTKMQNGVDDHPAKARINRRKHRSKKTTNIVEDDISVLWDDGASTSMNSSPIKIPNDINNCLNNVTLSLNNMIIEESSSKLINVDVTPKKQKAKNKHLTDNVINVDKSKSPSNIMTPQKSNSAKKRTRTPRDKNRQRKDSEHTTPGGKDNSDYEFPDYLTTEEVKHGLATGVLFTGYIRINPKDYKLAYITNPIKTEQDFLIISLRDRNAALEGDHVVVKLKPQSEWKTNNQKTASVVFIIEKIHPRTTIGILKLMPDKNKRYALFIPRDSRVPRIKIPFTDWPVRFYDYAEEYEKILFLGKILKWSEPKYAYGTILENIGMSGDIKTETSAILAENCLNIEPYTKEMKKYFPKTGDISPEEYMNRLDLRKECIFTIDPATARDLDDAMSCKKLPNGNFEVGVHISDVTYYLKEDTPLDDIVCNKATSVYMVESVYHMLPKELCMICSLLPGEDKLAFSVFWELTPEGKVIRHKFARTVINSCAQLAYEHAQEMIENPNKDFTVAELPEIFNGYKPCDLSTIVNNLQQLAVILRETRFSSGALRIDQPKVQFSLDLATCLPESFTLFETKDCHKLIEEFMLLANITVATRLRNDYPKIAFLRSHPAPNDFMMLRLKSFLEEVGIHLDVSCASGLQQSLWKYSADDCLSQARMMVLNLLCAKPMTRAHYFCANDSNDAETYWHYALSIPLYTHFTSPIRRYADIIAHRQLAGSLGYRERPDWPEEYVSQVAANCNKQKFNAKRAGEQSIELYLIQYIAQNQPMYERAVVMDLKDNSFDAIIISNGLTVRIYLNNLDEDAKYHFLNENQTTQPEEAKKHLNLTIEWPQKDNKPAKKQIIAIFSIIIVSLSKKDKILKLETKLIRPDI